MKARATDRQLFFLLVSFYSLNLFIASFGVFYRKLTGQSYETLTYIDLLIDLIFLNWVLMLFFTYVIMKTTKFFLDKGFKWYRIIMTHTVFSLLFTVLIWIVGTCVLVLLRRIPFEEITWNLFIGDTISVLDENFTLYFALVAIVYTYYYFEKSLKGKIESVTLKNQLADTRLKALTSQLQPHFLFNTLHGIHSLMDINIKKSKDMLVNLSDLLRGLIKNRNESLILLKDELAFLDKYLEIVKERFDDHLTIDREVDEELRFAWVPNMLLQPLVENSIKHGYSERYTNLSVHVKIYSLAESLVFEIANNGKPLSGSLESLMTQGTGLKNITSRLKTLYKQNYRMELINVNDKVIAKISVPLEFDKEQLAEYPAYHEANAGKI